MFSYSIHASLESRSQCGALLFSVVDPSPEINVESGFLKQKIDFLSFRLEIWLILDDICI